MTKAPAQTTVPEAEAATELSGDVFSVSAGWRVTLDSAQTFDGQDALTATGNGESLTLKRGPARWVRLRYRTFGKSVQITSSPSAQGARSLSVTWPDTAGAWGLGEIPIDAGASAVIRSTGALALDAGESLVLPTPTLGEAMGQPPWSWTQGGVAAWAPTVWPGYTGPAGAVASFSAPSQSAWLETTVPGPGLLTFTRWLPSAVTLAVTVDGIGVPLAAADQGISLAGSGPRTVRWTCTHSSASPGAQPVYAGLGVVTFVPAGPPASAAVLDGWTGLSWSLDAAAGTYELIQTADGAQSIDTLAVRRASRPLPATAPSLTTSFPGPGRLAFEFQGMNAIPFEFKLGGAVATPYIEPSTGDWSKVDLVWAQPDAVSFSLSLQTTVPVHQRLLIRRMTWQPATVEPLAVAADPLGLALPDVTPPFGGLGGLAWAPDGQDAVFHTDSFATFQVPVPGLLRTVARQLPNLKLPADAFDGLPFPWHHTATVVDTPDLGSDQSTLRIDAGSAGKDQFQFLPFAPMVTLADAADAPGVTGTAYGVAGPSGAALSRDGVDLAILAKQASGIPQQIVRDQPDDSYVEWWARSEGGNSLQLRVGSINPETNAPLDLYSVPLTRTWRRFVKWHQHSFGAVHLLLTGPNGSSLDREGVALVDQVRSFVPKPVPLTDALDLPPGLTVDTHAAAPWQGRATGGWSRDGEDVAVLPTLEPGQSSWLKINLPGPGRLLLATEVAGSQAHPDLGITRRTVLPDGSASPSEVAPATVLPSDLATPPIFKDQAYLFRSAGPQSFEIAVDLKTSAEPIRHRQWVDAVRFEPAIPLADAADLPGVIWRTDAANPWLGLASPGLSPDGVDAQLSPVFSPATEDPTYGSGWIEAEISGPVTLEYWSRGVSAPLCDGQPWHRSEVLRSAGRSRLHVPAGIHVLRWRHLASHAVMDQFRIVPDDGPMSAIADSFFWMASERVTPASLADAAGSLTAWSIALPGDPQSLDEHIRLLAPRHGTLRFRARTSTPVLAMGQAATTDGVGQRYLTDAWRTFSLNIDRDSSRTIFLPPTGTGPAGRSLQVDGIEFVPSASLAFEEALDSPAGLTWTANHPNWQAVGSATASHDGVDAVVFEWARDTNRESWMETQVTGPGRFSFWMRTGEGRFFADVSGRRLLELDEPPLSEGAPPEPWRQHHFDLPEGAHAVRLGFQWTRRAELDEVRFDPLPAPLPAAVFGASPASPTAWLGSPTVLPSDGPEGGPAVQLGAEASASQGSFQQAVPTPSIARFWWRRVETVPPTTNHFASIDLGSRLGSGLRSSHTALKPGWHPVEVPILQSAHDSLRIATRSTTGNGLQIANLEIEPVTPVSLQEALDTTELSFSGINGLAGVKSPTSTHDAVDAVLTPWSSGASLESTRPRLTAAIAPAEGGVLSFWVRGGDDGCRALSFILKNPPLGSAPWQYVEMPVPESVSEIRWDLKSTMAPDGSFVPTALDQVDYRIDPPYSRFLIWMSTNLPPSEHFATSDTDGDGWPALIEYASGLSPTQPNPINTAVPFEIPSPPLLEVQELEDGTHRLRADFVRSSLVGTDVTLDVHVSSDEGRTWQPLGGGTNEQQALDGFPDFVRVTRLVPLAPTPSVQIFRIQASLQ